MTTGWSAANIQAIRTQLDRILTHDLFDQADRQRRFLQFVVDEELKGRGEQVNQYAIAIDVFDRNPSFDAQLDSIVRVEARRLRSKLTEYYLAAGRNDPVVIEMPKGHYRARIAMTATSSAERSDQTRPPQRDEKATGTDEPPAIAVLPFDNFSGDPNQEYFSDGMAEDIITDLSKLSGLRVISRHSTFVYKGQSRSAKEVGAELRARYVLEGSVRKSATRVRITAQLIDAQVDGHLWAERYDRDLDDIFAIQDDVSRKIVAALQLRLSTQEEQRLRERGTRNPEAHDLYLRAQEQFYRFTPEGIQSARQLFSESIERDGRNAEAHAWQARVLVMMLISGIDPSRAKTLEPAVASARRAVELDPLLPLAHSMLGWTLMWYGKGEEAMNEAGKAVRLDANFADGLLWHSLTLSSMAYGTDALSSIERSMRLDLHHTATHLLGLAMSYFALGDHDEAVLQCERGIRRNPDFVFNHVVQAAMMGLAGRVEEAVDVAARIRAFPQHKRVIKEAVRFFNDPALRSAFRDGLRKAGLPP